MMVQGSVGVAVPVRNLSAGWGVDDQRDAPAALPGERAPLSVPREAGWAPGPVWTDAAKRKSFCPHRGLNSEPHSQ